MIPLSAGKLLQLLHPKPHSLWDSRRLWSLADMINFALGRYLLGRNILRTLLSQTQGEAYLRPNETVNSKRADEFEQNAMLVVRYCIEESGLDDLVFLGVDIENLVRNHKFQPYSWNRINTLLQRLDSDLERQESGEFFFHCSHDAAMLVSSVKQRWESVIKKFPSSEPELISGIDCYAIGHNTACVFHMMRVCELGLRAIGQERGVQTVGNNKPIEWGTWQDVFQAIESKLKILRNKPAGLKKETALRFYDGAISNLRDLQNNYRDPTMHFRESYNPVQAYSAMFLVKSLMENLSTKLQENMTTEIDWGL